MATTFGSTAGSKVTYLSWGRRPDSANNGTFLVNHSADAMGARMVSIRDNNSNGGLGRIIPSDEYVVDLMSDTQIRVTNLCGAAAITTPAVAGAGNVGTAITFTTAGAYTGLADGDIIVTATRSGATVGVTTAIDPAVLTGAGTAVVLEVAGIYTGNVNGVITGVVTLTGATGNATVDWTFPDGALVPGWVSGASTVATPISQGVTLAITTVDAQDLVIGDILEITVWAVPQIQAVFPDGTTGAVVDTGATTVGADIGQGVTLAMTTQAGTDVVEGDTWAITVNAGTKDLTAFVQVVGY